MTHYSKFVFFDKKGFDMIVKEELGNRSFRLQKTFPKSCPTLQPTILHHLNWSLEFCPLCQSVILCLKSSRSAIMIYEQSIPSVLFRKLLVNAKINILSAESVL